MNTNIMDGNQHCFVCTKVSTRACSMSGIKLTKSVILNSVFIAQNTCQIRLETVTFSRFNTVYRLPWTQHPVFLLSRYNVPTPLPSKTFLITTDTTSGVSAVMIQCTNTTYCLPQCFCCQDTMYQHHCHCLIFLVTTKA